MNETNIDLKKLLSVVQNIFNTVDELKQICEEIIDCDDKRLINARLSMADAEIILHELEEQTR